MNSNTIILRKKFFIFLILEIPGFKGFDSPIHNDDFDYNFEEQEEIIEDKEDNRDNFETYQKNVMDMKKHEQNQLEIVRIELYIYFITAYIYYFYFILDERTIGNA